MTGPDQGALSQILNYAFADAELLREALSHASIATTDEDAADYQRLEFLGDRVLGLIAAEYLYKRDSGAAEGTLAVRYNATVRRESLAKAAEEAGLQAFIRLGPGEQGGAGTTKPSILADVFEAVAGAIYLDGGLEAARRFILDHLKDTLDDAATAEKDPKSRLQELLQGRGEQVPQYNLLRREGPDHAPRFTVEVVSEGGLRTEGVGGSKRIAEQAAAEALLTQLEDGK